MRQVLISEQELCILLGTLQTEVEAVTSELENWVDNKEELEANQIVLQALQDKLLNSLSVGERDAK